MLEKRGVPAVPAASEGLARSSGAGMARAWGRPDLEWAIIPKTMRSSMAPGSSRTPEELKEIAEVLAPQVEAILTGRKTRR